MNDMLGSCVGEYLLKLLGYNALWCGKQQQFEGTKVKDEGSMLFCDSGT
jgi:hypothetical protein